MNNYVRKNILLFAGAVTLSFLVIGMIQVLSADRKLINKERAELRTVQGRFQEHIASSLQQQFGLIDFLTNTSYPSVAITFRMNQQFNATVDSLDEGFEHLGLILLDNGLNVVAHRGIPDDLSALVHQELRHIVANPPYFVHPDFVSYSKPVRTFGSKERIGLLVGIRSTASLRSALRAAYVEVTGNFRHLRPDMTVFFPNSPSADVDTIRFHFEEHAALTNALAGVPIGYPTLFAIGIVLLILFTVILRRSLTRPIDQLMGVVSFAAANAHGVYKGALPKDRIFYRVAEAILQMHTHRTEQECVARERVAAERQAELARRVAHDIRSPLTSLKTAVAMLGQTRGASCPNDIANLLQLSSVRLEQLANELLARPHGDDLPSQQLFSIHAICDELVGELQGQSMWQGVRFLKTYHPAALYVEGDRCGLQRAVGNLIKNALEAMGGQSEQQLLLTTELKNEQVVLRISDTGPGIPEDKIPLILRGGYTEGKADGHGIGMQVVRDVVTSYQGTLACASTVGSGTTFIIHLPEAQCTGKDIPTCVIQVRGRDPVVVIDDDACMREQWRLLLRMEGVMVRVYASWEEYAQDVASYGKKVDANGKGGTAIVDYHFDNCEMNGLDVCRRLQEEGVDHVILCTAEYWKPVLKREAATLGIPLCPKPLPRIQVKHVAEDARCEADGVKRDPVAVGTTTTADGSAGARVLVIDDDDSIRLAWALDRRRLGIGELTAFASMEACEAAQPAYAQFDFAFVDKNIPDTVWRIDQVIAHLKARGVKQVIVATGESARDVAEDPLCADADGIAPEKIPEALPIPPVPSTHAASGTPV